jgi:hypothetical protein
MRQLKLALAIAFCLLPCVCHGQTPDDFATTYAVHIERTPKQSWPGYGIYLGSGLVLTAQHVVHPVAITRPKVLIAGLVLPATAVKEGDLDTLDVTLLKIDEKRLPPHLQGTQISLCIDPPRPGQSVFTAIPEGIAKSTILAPEFLPKNVSPHFFTVIKDVATTGNSGSGLFDETTKCLLGIISRKIEGLRTVTLSTGETSTTREDIAKFFEPASKIAKFMPKGIIETPYIESH